MSMINRYNFTKNLYNDYVVLIKRKNKYYSFNKDKRILDYIKFDGKLFKLRKYNINYIILEDLEIINMDSYKVNNYNKYLYISYIEDILFKVKRSIYSE